MWSRWIVLPSWLDWHSSNICWWTIGLHCNELDVTIASCPSNAGSSKCLWCSSFVFDPWWFLWWIGIFWWVRLLHLSLLLYSHNHHFRFGSSSNFGWNGLQDLCQTSRRQRWRTQHPGPQPQPPPCHGTRWRWCQQDHCHCWGDPIQHGEWWWNSSTTVIHPERIQGRRWTRIVGELPQSTSGHSSVKWGGDGFLEFEHFRVDPSYW